MKSELATKGSRYPDRKRQEPRAGLCPTRMQYRAGRTVRPDYIYRAVPADLVHGSLRVDLSLSISRDISALQVLNTEDDAGSQVAHGPSICRYITRYPPLRRLS